MKQLDKLKEAKDICFTFYDLYCSLEDYDERTNDKFFFSSDRFHKSFRGFFQISPSRV